MNKRGRKPVLDETKKREIVAILAMGCSRRTAARYVGCAPSTISYTAQRDDRFAKELRTAGQAAEINYLRNIQNAAKKEQYWRAAAWALERCHPDRYAARAANSITLDQVRQLLAELAQIICDEIENPKHRQAILRRLGALLKGFCLSREKQS